jgi:hypothetical protein
MKDRAEYYKACVAQWVHLYKDESLEKILSDMEDDELLKSPYDEDFAQIVGMAKRLRELTRWISVSERLPTEADADQHGYVIVRDADNESSGETYHSMVQWDNVGKFEHFYTITNWKRIDP